MADPEPEAPPSAVRQPANWRAPAALCALALLAYANCFSLGVAQDATAFLKLDDRIRAFTAANLRLIASKTYWWPQAVDGLYRPIATLSFLFNYALLGNRQNPAGYHAVNFLLHAGNAWLVYALARRLLRDTRAAFLAAALWAVHPIGVEAVANIAGRADLLAAMAVLGGLLLYARLDDLSGWRLHASTAGLFAVASAGVFSKENAAVLLGLMALWDLCRGARTPLREWLQPRRIAAYAAVAASLALMWAVRGAAMASTPAPQVFFTDNPLRAGGFLAARWTAVKVLALDLGLLVWPAGLSCDRSYGQIPLAGPSDWVAWIGLAMVVAVLGAVIARYRRDRVPFFAAGFFALAILPTSNLIVPIGSIMAERFLYLPSVGFAIAVVVLAGRAAPRRIAETLLAIALVLCCWRTFTRTAAWHDDVTLAATDVRTAPASFKLHDMLAKALHDRDRVGNLPLAVAEEERAWAILEPLPPRLSTPMVPSNLGAYYREMGDAAGGASTSEGRGWYRKSADILLRGRDISRAVEQSFEETQSAAGKPPAARVEPQNLYLNLAGALLGLGRYAEAREACRYAQGLDPRRLACYNGMAQASLGMDRPRDAAVAAIERGLMEGFQPGTLAGIARFYGKVPEASCAMVGQGGEARLNLQCPAVADDFCRATAELIAAHREARMDEAADRLAQTVAPRYGCSSLQ